jgi:hypothetical protein
MPRFLLQHGDREVNIGVKWIAAIRYVDHANIALIGAFFQKQSGTLALTSSDEMQGRDGCLTGKRAREI